MIAQGKAISHGARAIEYSMEKDKAQLVKVHDLPENIEPLAMWSRMMQHQHQCMKDRYNPKPIKLNALRFEISPAKEESAGWTMTDWQNLADEFIAVLDGIDRRCGKPDSHLKPTNIKNSQYVVSLHTDSKSGIPHLHIVANRIDNMDKTNDAHYIGERAVHAANIINERRGWVQSVQRRDENIQQISEDCIAILKAMPEFDWETYSQMLNAKGYDIKLIKDDKEVVKGYAIRKGNSIYKSSILGKSRKLMPSKIEATWVGLHASDKQTAIQSKEVCTQTMAHNNKEVMPQSKPSINHYSITVDGEQLELIYQIWLSLSLTKSLEALMKKSNRPIYSKLPPYYLPDIWMLLLLWRLQAEVVAVPVADGVKIRTMMSVTGLFVVQKWQNGSANRLNVAGVDSISFIITYNHA